MSVHELSTDSRIPSFGGQVKQWAQWIGQQWYRSRITLGVAGIALLTLYSPTLTSWLQLDVNAVQDGQWWRVLTGHVTHFGGEHLFWDLAMFVGLGLMCESAFPRRFAPGLLLLALGISFTVLIGCEDISQYRGLSGIDTGLFAWYVGEQIRQSREDGDWGLTTAWITAACLLVGKLFYEWFSGNVIFVNASEFSPLVESHLAGTAIGSLLALLPVLKGDRALSNP